MLHDVRVFYLRERLPFNRDFGRMQSVSTGMEFRCSLDNLWLGESMSENREPIHIAGSALRHSCHVCAFFHSKAEEYNVLMPFIKEGLEKGDRAFHVIDPKNRQAHLQRLEEEGINVKKAEADGQLEVRRWQDAYTKDGYFEKYRMIDTIKNALDPVKNKPGKVTRLVANMEWALEKIPGVHEIVEYETRLNYVLPKYHDP